MKKVGILTFHFADNYGAVLQCYALRKVINKYDGFSAEIVPYIPKSYHAPQYWIDDNTFSLYLEKRKRFKNFLIRNLGVKEEVCSAVDGTGFDIICVGSDQVWNRACMNTKEYFLPNVRENIKKISYAASLGLSPNCPELDKESIKTYLPYFQNISVREYEHVRLVEELTKKECYCVLDPTLLLDAKEYDEIICKEDLEKESFLFFFWLYQNEGNDRGAIELANKIARRYKLKILHNYVDAPNYMFVNDGGCRYFESIENFLWYMKNAKFVITDSYHGTIFAIQFQKPFYTFVCQKVRSRVDTLAEKIGIRERVLEHGIKFDLVDDTVNYLEINKKINEHRKCSLEYLEHALGVNEYEEGGVYPKIEVFNNEVLNDNPCLVKSVETHKDRTVLFENLSKSNRVDFTSKNELKLNVDKKDRQAYLCPIIQEYLKNQIKGYGVRHILKDWNIKKVALYAIAEFTGLFYDDIKFANNEIAINCICDKSMLKQENGFKDRAVVDVDSLITLYQKHEIEIVVICSAFYANEIFDELIEKGVSLEDIVSPTEIIYAIGSLVIE